MKDKMNKQIKTSAPFLMNVSDIPMSGIQGIDYMGKVTVKLARDNKILKTKTYNNSGTPSLFKFLCNCLAGVYTDSLRPCKIKLFTFDATWSGDNAYTPGAFNWQTAFSSNATPIPVTPYVVYETTPIVKYVQENTEQEIPEHYETTFHFRVPFSLLADKIIHMVGIFPNNAISPLDVSAYYLFTKENSNKILEWDPIMLSGVTGNFSLIIDWTMSISNKLKSTATQNAAQ